MDGRMLAVIADVHGNRWALEAVLEDIDRRNVREVVNLGDSLYGPLDPAGTARLLRALDPVSIRDNQDRVILDPGPESDGSPTLDFVLDALDASDLDWLGTHRPRGEVWGGRVLLCHGTPEHDDRYLIEAVGAHGVALQPPRRLGAALAGVSAEVVLCGHSHVPRVVAVPDGPLVVNPGSVGLPAYEDDAPHPHAMEAGSPHARYAILGDGPNGWTVQHIAVAYDWERAAREARARGRDDWAAWLVSGRART